MAFRTQIRLSTEAFPQTCVISSLPAILKGSIIAVSRPGPQLDNTVNTVLSPSFPCIC